MKDIKITSKTNYQIKLPDGVYYPALLDVFDLTNYVEVNFYLPDENNNLVLKSRNINASELHHLYLLDGEKKSPKVFIHKGLAEILHYGDFSKIPSFLIKGVSEVENYKEYFDIFKSTEPPRDIFSKYKGTAFFPNK